MDYTTKKWSEVLQIVSGKNQKSVECENGQFPIYGSGGIIGRANSYLCEAGTTIIGRKGTINSPIFVSERFWNVDTAFGLTPLIGLHPKYLFYFCILFNFKALDKSTTIPSLAKRDLLNISMPVPSFHEQERIVARIEELFSELDKAVETLQTTKQQLAVYRQAVLKEAFEGIDKFQTLNDITERIFDGPFGTHLKTADYTSSGIRVVRLENIKNLAFDNSKQSFITEEKYSSIVRHTVFPSDIIMSTFIAGEMKVCQLPNNISFAVNKADCIGIRVKGEYCSKYVMYYLSSKKVYQELLLLVHGATRPRVNTTQIKSIHIPKCDMAKQIEIVTTIESHLSVCDSIEQTVDTALAQSEAMRQSILKQAFEGGFKQ